MTIVRESWDFRVTDVLKVSLDENLKMVSDTIAYLKAKNREVFLMPSIFLMDIKESGICLKGAQCDDIHQAPMLSYYAIPMGAVYLWKLPRLLKMSEKK